MFPPMARGPGARHDPLVARAARTVVAAAAAMPSLAGLGSELRLIDRACGRGDFLPDEDDRIRGMHARSLTTRAVLSGALALAEPLAVEGPWGWSGRQDALLTALAAAWLLTRGANFLAELARERPVLWKKLDEPWGRPGVAARRGGDGHGREPAGPGGENFEKSFLPPLRAMP